MMHYLHAIFGAILLLLELFAAYVLPYGSYEPLCTVSQTTDRVPVRSTYYTHFTPSHTGTQTYF